MDERTDIRAERRMGGWMNISNNLTFSVIEGLLLKVKWLMKRISTYKQRNTSTNNEQNYVESIYVMCRDSP